MRPSLFAAIGQVQGQAEIRPAMVLDTRNKPWAEQCVRKRPAAYWSTQELVKAGIGLVDRNVDKVPLLVH